MDWQLLMAHLNSVGSWENKLPDNAQPIGLSLPLTSSLGRVFLIWRECALWAFTPCTGAFEPLSQGWKLQGWGGGPWWAPHTSQLDANTAELEVSPPSP